MITATVVRPKDFDSYDIYVADESHHAIVDDDARVVWVSAREPLMRLSGLDQAKGLADTLHEAFGGLLRVRAH